MTQFDTILSQIAREKLFIPTLETRHSDHLDFHDVSVWGVKMRSAPPSRPVRHHARPRRKRPLARPS